MERRAGYFAFKGLHYILGRFLCQMKDKEHFLETDGKFQSTGNGTEKISTFHLVLGGYCLKSACGTATAALLMVLAKLPLGRCLSCKPTTVAGNLVVDF